VLFSTKFGKLAEIYMAVMFCIVILALSVAAFGVAFIIFAQIHPLFHPLVGIAPLLIGFFGLSAFFLWLSVLFEMISEWRE
jgi:hypothetical protein